VFWFLVLLETPRVLARKHWKTWPMLTVVIPAYNEEDCIRETMESVLAADYPHEKLQLIVVNDGSQDNTERVAKVVAAEHRERSIQIITQSNGGKGTALNRGLKLAKGDFFATMDSDSRVFADVPKKLISCFTKDNIAAVVPAMKVREPKTFLQKLQWYEYNVNMFYKDLMGRVDALHVIPGPFPVYRTDVIKKIGGFATDGNLTEDLEITLRLQSKQYRILQVMDAFVDTIAPLTLREFYAQRNRWFKGALLNAFSYRKLAFKREYGDFGMIQMPTLLISGALALMLILTTIFNTLNPVKDFFRQLSYVNFDIITLIRTLQWNVNVFDFDYVTMTLMVVMLGLSALMFFLAHRLMRERLLEHGLFTAGVFMLIYYLLLGVVWAGVAVELAFGKRQRW
ncbi:glycosyltransferase family 2 protein, partial [Candidatus Woesearchaeota archaeon]|nr:glycosyltransferase family 2 protein [Candidatus Woesearchaeota archaeon]